MTALVLRGDARALPLPDESVDLIVTSPPYWGLRDYRDGGASLAGQIGSEPTPQLYVASLLDCTREWARVLKPTGSIWVNLGDKFATRWSSRSEGGGLHYERDRDSRGGRNTTGVAGKSLIGLPWRYALGCIDELGLILRQDVIDDEAADAYVWAKANGMPESVGDRCRRAHEYLFHLVKQPRYFAATDEIREPHTEASVKRAAPHRSPGGRALREGRVSFGTRMVPHTLRLDQSLHPLGRLPGSVWTMTTQPFTPPEALALEHFAAFPVELPRRIILGWSSSGICIECGAGRFPVTTYTGDEGRHPGGGGTYRAMRPAGARDTNLADASLKLRRITGYACDCTPYTDHEGSGEKLPRKNYGDPAGLGQFAISGGVGKRPQTGPWREYHFDGWQPAATVPAVVLDPFGGTGTTALVADVLGRTGISVDRSLDYCRLARWRTTDPGERARALDVPKPPPVIDGQLALDF